MRASPRFLAFTFLSLVVGSTPTSVLATSGQAGCHLGQQKWRGADDGCGGLLRTTTSRRRDSEGAARASGTV